MRTEIKDLHERLETTTIYVTHDQIEAMTMADRIVVMRAGVVEQIGTPLELYDSPANTFVASFIGSPAMNLMRGKIVAADVGRVLELEGGQRLLVRPSLAPARDVHLGMRPEHISLGDSGIAARVVVLEPTGAETQIVADVDGQRVTLVVKDRVEIKRGDLVHLVPDPARLLFFDAATGVRLPWLAFRHPGRPARRVPTKT